MKSLEDMTIGNLFEKNARFFPDKTVQVFEDGKRKSYRELDERANKLANGLLSLGLKKGDHVAMLAMNCLEYMEYQLATAKIGMVSVLVNCFMPKDRIVYMLTFSDSKAVIFESQYLEAVRYAFGQKSELKHLIMIDRTNAGKSEGIILYEELIGRSSGAKPIVDVKITDPNSLLFTTGTTGMPKAVLKTMAADMYHPIVGAIHYPRYDAVHKLGLPPYSHLVSLLMPPQFHLGGQSATLGPLIFPATVVVMRTFDPEKFLRLVSQEKVNVSWIQPAMLYRIKKLPEETLRKYEVSSVICIICGSTTLKDQERKDFEAFFHNATLGSCYAATEFAIVTYISQEELAVTRPDNLGIPVFSADLKIMDDQDRELPPNQIGHIWVKSPALPIGCRYYKNEEATRKGFRDGWSIVGDMGWRDEKGYFYFYGRGDDIIKSGGEKVSPVPIEEIIQQHPKVGAAAVVGIPDEKWQEAVVAAVVPIKGQTVSPEEIISFCKDKVATYEVPKKVYVFEELPVGTTGKVNRERLKELIKENK
jgi:fatty-acyl-CoA synthase